MAEHSTIADFGRVGGLSLDDTDYCFQSKGEQRGESVHLQLLKTIRFD